ncbi:hypothetical protein [Haemophilus haemolyticus]|nr:hypothetical protein [Haemophilus haemolyticus]
MKKIKVGLIIDEFLGGAGTAYVKNIHNIADFTTNLRKVIIDTVKED